MDKKLARVGKIVDFEADNFFDYLKDLLDDEVKTALDRISKKTNLYLFSGLIRNYFLAVFEYRDIDVVCEQEIDVIGMFSDYEVKKNSFGGYKISFGSSVMDLWYIKDTWAFKHNKQKKLELQLEYVIPHTAFFNFSSVIFCINTKKFYYTDHFLKFLINRELDYVEERNPNYGLCIVNTFYYSQKFKLKISNRLLSLIKKLDNENDFDYDTVQLKHFGRIIYSKTLIKQKLNKRR